MESELGDDPTVGIGLAAKKPLNQPLPLDRCQLAHKSLHPLTLPPTWYQPGC